MDSYNMKQSANAANPRRQPAYLSVSLKHGTVNQLPASRKRVGLAPDLHAFPLRQRSDESPASGELSGSNIKQWFDHSNKQPATAVPRFEDDEPPYFLPHDSSNESNDVYINRHHRHNSNGRFTGLTQGMLNAAENDNSADDYRSVIDDLTIENKKLKERLRKYESMHNAHLDKDKLFEVKIHSLPPSKRKELEDTLRTFASSIDGSTDAASSSIPKKKSSSHHPPRIVSTSGSASKNPSSSSTSHSRPMDSAYVSMSNSGPTSTSTLNLYQVSKNPSRVSKDQNIQSFLHDIPEGLLPKHAITMTERQKKKLVVKRLEQIFTGKVRGVLNSHSQHLQQQEVSKLAARANEHMNDFMSEGLREASILPHVIDVDEAVAPESNQNGENSISPELSGSLSGSPAGGTPTTKSSPDQRPTRPLDLDPDREQNPMDNIEYIRHLGLSPPQLATEDSSDAEPDAEGWVYLNLLINMAQLHIMNVTPDFVRASVSELSTKFQLSSDGKRIRWRGGSTGTRLSSDSDSPFGDRSYDSGDGMGDTSQKRRKVDGPQDRSVGQFASVPIPIQTLKSEFSSMVRPAQAQSSSFHYKPLFHHKLSEGDLTSRDDCTSSLGSSPREPSRFAGIARGTRIWGHRSMSQSPGRRRRDDGPIVFYSGATFCTDLSSDRSNIATPLHAEELSSDGYSKSSDAALGCAPQRPVSTLARTTSGSLMRSRPFRDYGEVGDSSSAEGNRAPTPELMTYDSTDDDQDVLLTTEWSSIPDSNLSNSPALLDFSVSGLGGTQPADHFAVAVQTVRTKLGDHPARNKCSGLRHPSVRLNLLKKIKDKQTAHDLSERLASPSTSYPKDKGPFEEPPIKLQIVDTRVLRLKPSQLPEPLNYYDSMSNSDEESDCSESSGSVLSKFRRPESSCRRPTTHLSSPDIHSLDVSTDMESDDEIDMLASLRRIDPENVAAIEHEFEMEVDQPVQLLAVSSAATVDGGSGSGYSSGRSSN